MMELLYSDDWDSRKKEVMVCMEEKYLKCKRYDLYLAALIQGIAEYSEQDQCAKFRVKLARQTAVANFGLTYHRFNVGLQAMEELGFVRQIDKEWYEIEPFAKEGKKFVKVKMGDVRECLLRDLTSFEFKVFLIFRNVEEIKKAKGIKGDFLFSAKSMLEECGYSYAEKNRKMFESTLSKLEEVNLIGYNHNGVYKPNRGQYKALKWAEVRSLESDADLSEEISREIGWDNIAMKKNDWEKGMTVLGSGYDFTDPF